MKAKDFLIGRLIASDGFPVHKNSLKDGYYSIDNIASVLEEFVKHKMASEYQLINSDQKDKRFLVFGHNQYYPSGGMADLIDSFDTLDEAIEYIRNHGRYDGYDLYDRIEGYEIDLSAHGK